LEIKNKKGVGTAASKRHNSEKVSDGGLGGGKKLKQLGEPGGGGGGGGDSKRKNRRGKKLEEKNTGQKNVCWTLTAQRIEKTTTGSTKQEGVRS